MALREIGCEDWRWMQVAQDRVQWRALVLTASDLWVLLQESWLSSKMAHLETVWEELAQTLNLSALVQRVSYSVCYLTSCRKKSLISLLITISCQIPCRITCFVCIYVRSEQDRACQRSGRVKVTPCIPFFGLANIFIPFFGHFLPFPPKTFETVLTAGTGRAQRNLGRALHPLHASPGRRACRRMHLCTGLHNSCTKWSPKAASGFSGEIWYWDHACNPI
jgi:hypothetical protein